MRKMEVRIMECRKDRVGCQYTSTVRILMDSITEDGVAGKYENELRKRI